LPKLKQHNNLFRFLNSLHNDTENNCADDLRLAELYWSLLHSFSDPDDSGIIVLNFEFAPLS